MATYSVKFYDADYLAGWPSVSGSSFVYSGLTDYDATAFITDTQTGADGTMLDSAAAGETATADVTVNGTTYTGAAVEAETVYLVQDTLTGQTFEVVRFNYVSGGTTYTGTLSESPLIDGRTYEVLDIITAPDVGASDESFAYADFSDGLIEGTAGDDTIDASYTGDPHGDVVDGSDGVNDIATDSTFRWSDYGGNATDISAGISDTINGVGVDVSYTALGTGDWLRISTQTTYTEAGEAFSANSAASLHGNGTGPTSRLEFDFSSATDGVAGDVSNLTFRVNEIDASAYLDQITVTAFDANGDPVEVRFTVEGNETISGNTITAGDSSDAAGSADGSVLITIAGPVSHVELYYENLGRASQGITVSDLNFDAIAPTYADLIDAGAGNDLIDAGFGDDTILAGTGDDTVHGGAGSDQIDAGDGDDVIYLGSGDDALGGDGDDIFIIDPALLSGGTITIDGAETGEDGAGDVLDFNGTLAGPITWTAQGTDPGGRAGTATLTDGTVINFTNIETVICFARGTRILTPRGPVAIEALKPGDPVLTRDNGIQPVEWINSRRVPATGRFAPIHFAAGAMGNESDLIVSPQHRMLMKGHKAELLFGQREVLAAAKHLVNGTTITALEGGFVEYFHVMFRHHELIYAEGAIAESFHPGDHALRGLADPAREELFALFPDLRSLPDSHGPTARLCLRGHETRLLVAA